MSLYDQIQQTYMESLKTGETPKRIFLPEAALDELLADRSLSSVWDPYIRDKWGQKLLGLPLSKTNGIIALEVGNKIIPLGEPT